MAELSVQAELEMRITASLLAEPGWIGETAALVTPEDFTEEGGCRDIFAALRSLFLAGKPVTPMAVTLEAGDWTKDLIRALRSQPLAAVTRQELAGLCESLQERSRVRKVAALASRLAMTSEPELSDHLVDEINGAMTRRRGAKVATMGEAAVAFLTDLDKKPLYLPWGIKRLDEELFVEPGDFVVIGGYASSGKTLLSLQMAQVLAEHYRVGYFSLETSPGKIFARLIAHRAGVGLKQIKRRELAPGEVDKLTKAATELNKLPLELVHAGGMSVSDIQATALAKRYEVIFVDYLQLAEAPGNSRYEKVTAISIALHTLAQTHGVTVIALAQLTRPEKSKGKIPPPSMSSFRESGQIEQDADVAMLLYPTDPDDNGANRILKVSKNKEGEKLRLELAFDGATQTLTPVSNDRATAQKFVNEGRKVKQKLRQERLDGFEDEEEQFQHTDEEVPF